jgi:quaternary ammonium compound-resistance protein SugE
MAWLILIVAAILEIGWAIGLKLSEGFTRYGIAAATIAAMIASMALLGLAARTLPIGTAYAVWTGIGAAGTALIGIWLLGEPVTFLRLGSIGLIIAGVIGLKLATSS